MFDVFAHDKPKMRPAGSRHGFIYGQNKLRGEKRRGGADSLTGFKQYFSCLLLDSISGGLQFALGFLLTDLHYFRVLGHLVQLLG